MTSLSAVTRSSAGIPSAHDVLMPLPPEIAGAIDDAVAPPRYSDHHVARTVPRFHPAAADAAAAMASALVPPSRAVVLAWLSRLALAVKNPPAPEAFAARCGEIMGACGDLGAVAWTTATLATAQRSLAWWPAIAELDAVLRPVHDDLARRHRVVTGMAVAPADAQGGASPEPRQPPTEAEKAAVAATLAALRQEQAAAQPKRAGAVRATVRTVSAEVLAAHYRGLIEKTTTPAFRHLAELRLAALEGR